MVYFAPQNQSANQHFYQYSQVQMNANSFQPKVSETQAISNKLAYNPS